jgi:hypothetical protein
MTNRGLHRDIAYFYVGLIIAFSFSGIILNHRNDWYPMDYAYESKEVQLTLTEDIDEGAIIKFSEQWELASEYDGHRVRDNKLRVYYKGNIILDADIETGKGTIEYKRKVPFLGQTMYLHKSTNNAWIWYSDIFGVAMLIIAFTGMFIPIGEKGFKRRGWKLALIGMLFPLIFLFIIS